MHAFEVLVGPYAVAHLRLTQAIAGEGGVLPDDGVHVYLHDTLESPFVEPPGQQDMFHLPLRAENQRARQVKEAETVLVCLGNPPYDRQQIDPEDETTARKGGWVRRGDNDDPEGAILEDFLGPAREAGASVHVKNLYNDYVYFWRFALWKVFETSTAGGIVSFITASSYLRGPGFVGMRETMRRLLDEIWIIDLEGDNLGARKTENVFNIQTPVAIAIGIRRGETNRDTPSRVHYCKFTGTRDEKLSALKRIFDFDDLDWRSCYEDWRAPFLPEGQGVYFNWPLLTDLFPWQHSGVQFKRTWPIAPTEEALQWRWRTFAQAPQAEKVTLFRDTGARRVDRQYRSTATNELLPTLASLGVDDLPPVEIYAYRSLDRQFALTDARFADRPRPPLWAVNSEQQVYLSSLLTKVIGLGPSIFASSTPPDLDYFCGRGGKDIIPLWRDSEATVANITQGLLDLLSDEIRVNMTAPTLLSYVYAIMNSPTYVELFSEELVEPGPRMPITKDRRLFESLSTIGQRLIWLHTFGERMAPEGEHVGRIPQGTAKFVRAIPETEAGYPDRYEYSEYGQSLLIGAGVIEPVAKKIFEFSISGYAVVKSWLNYRMRGGAGRTSSDLDEIEATRWTAAMNDELLNVLWILEHTIEMYPDLEALVGEVVQGDVFSADELPTPTEAEREAPSRPTGDNSQNQLI